MISFYILNVLWQLLITNKLKVNRIWQNSTTMSLLCHMTKQFVSLITSACMHYIKTSVCSFLIPILLHDSEIITIILFSKSTSLSTSSESTKRGFNKEATKYTDFSQIVKHFEDMLMICKGGSTSTGDFCLYCLSVLSIYTRRLFNSPNVSRCGNVRFWDDSLVI